MQNNLIPGYILHHHPFSETSLRLDLFTESSGRLTVIAKGARRPKSFWRSLLVPFRPLYLSWVGKSDMKTLTQAEANGKTHHLTQTALWCGLYLNELILRLLTAFDPQPAVYQLYEKTLTQLAQTQQYEPVLRHFEYELLNLLGYGIAIQEADTGMPIAPDVMYQYHPEQGFVATQHLHSGPLIVSGASVLAMALNQFEDSNQLKEAKMILQSALQIHLGAQPLKTRQFFKSMQACLEETT